MYSFFKYFHTSLLLITLTSNCLSQDSWINQLDRYWGALKYNKIPPTHQIIDWDSVYLNIYPSISNAQNQRDVDSILSAFIYRFDKRNWKKATSAKAILSGKDYGILKNLYPPLLIYLDIISEAFTQNRINLPAYYSFCNSTIQLPCFNNEKSYALDSCKLEVYRSLSLAKFWNAIEYFYPYKNELPIGWDLILENYIPRFREINKNIEDYVLLTRELNAEILDPHVISSIQGSYSNYISFAPPFIVNIENNKLIVKKSSDTSIIKPGEEILKYNNQTIIELVKKKQKYFKTLNETALRTTKINQMLLVSKDSVPVQFIREKDTISCVLLTIPSRDLYKLNVEKKCFATNDSMYYLNLACYNDSSLLKKLQTFERGKTLILDLREYPKVSHNIISYFIDDSLNFGMNTIPKKNFPGKFINWKPAIVVGNSADLRDKFKEILVLINSETISKGEYIAAAFDDVKNVKLVGSNTAGIMGNMSFIELPGKVICTFTSTGFYDTNGRSLLKKGITPDQYNTLKDFDRTILKYEIK